MNQHGNRNVGVFLLNCQELSWYLECSAAVTWRIKRKKLSWKNWWCRNSCFSETVVFTVVEGEVSHSLVGRKCNFLQGVLSCDSRFGKAEQVNVSPVSWPVLYFGLKGRCVLQVWRDKNLQLCTVNKRFGLNELGFCPLEPELIRDSMLPGAWELWREWSWRLRRELKPHPIVSRMKGGGPQQQHKQQRERLASSSWPLIPGTKSGAENALISKCNRIKINCWCAGLRNLDKPLKFPLSCQESFVPAQPFCIQRC